MARKAVPAEVRFKEKYRIDESGCWLWTGPLTSSGYGQFRYDSGQGGYAHRFSYTHHVGPIPPKFTIDHLCRVRHCVNPEHLEAVSQRENIMRSDNAAAKNFRKTHCPQGHPYEGDNLYVNPTTGRRTCRTCLRASKAAWDKAHPEKLREYRAKWLSDPENLESRREYARTWIRTHRPSVDPEVQREYTRKYRENLREDARKWRELRDALEEVRRGREAP